MCAFSHNRFALQNLILKGHKQTKISAIKVQAGIDTGPVFLKKNLELFGTAEEIFLRAGLIIREMIQEIVSRKMLPIEQGGKAVIFKRRKPEDGNLKNVAQIEDLYNYIRMLDGEGYPNAFIETEFFRFEFSRASMKKNGLVADVKIMRK